MSTIDLSPFLKQQQLPKSYSTLVKAWFRPIAQSIATKNKAINSPTVVGINGAQGSGKSTLAALLQYLFEHEFNLKAVSLSIDDFYHTKATRKELGQKIHPLMETRGVPGTHDVDLAINVIQQLINGSIDIDIPRFNKATDDRHPRSNWDNINQQVDIIIFEGWCVGAESENTESLAVPVNALEEEKDPNGLWRQYANKQLASAYPELFNLINQWVMLKAPSFECVYAWRLEQEHKLRKTLKEPNQSMNDDQVLNFIQHYQRITQNILKNLPTKVDFLLELDSDRQIVSSVFKGKRLNNGTP